MMRSNLIILFIVFAMKVDWVRAAGKKTFRRILKGKGKKFRDIENADSHLIQFAAVEAENCEYHRAMEPLIERMEAELPLKVKKIVLSTRRSESYEVFTLIDSDVQCGGLPFFYNRRSHQSICGATTYANFKNWALGRPTLVYCPPPIEDITSKTEPVAQAPRSDLLSKIKTKIASVKSKGLGEMSNRREKKQVDSGEESNNTQQSESSGMVTNS